MRTPRMLAGGVALAIIAGLLTASAHPGSAAPPKQRRVIVMYTDDAAWSTATNQRGAKARKLGRLTRSAAMTVPETDLAALRQAPGVMAVYPDTPVRIATSASVPLVGAPQVWQRKDPSGVAATGKGVTVAVIDTGVDYGHADLGAGFGEGHKVVGGYDFVNGDTDPMDDNGHGTHVAGIAAGKAAAPGGITGVAPDAQITAYKVMDANGDGWSSDIIAGIEAAADPANPHRADVINLSIGGPGDGNDPISLAAAAATGAGVVVVAAAGNAGPSAGTVGAPGNAPGVISVGASTSNLVLPVAHLAGQQTELIQTYRGAMSANPPVRPITAELVDVGWGSPEDWANAGDISGKIVKVEMFIARLSREVYPWDLEIIREAERRGAIALLGGTSFGGGPVMSAAEPAVARVAADTRLSESGDIGRMNSIVVMGVDDTQFAELRRRLDSGRVDVTVSGSDVTDQIASFSSRGPSQSFGLKPDLVAPGVDIVSTVPTSMIEGGKYPLSGTSMAAPHVAGAAALLRQLRPDRTPADIASALVNTAKPLPGTSVTTAGSGRLDLVAAASTTLTAQPATLSYGLADLSKRDIGGSKQLTLRNDTGKALSVRLSAGHRDVTVKPDRVTIPARGTAGVTVTISADRPDTDTEISGLVTATAGTASIRIPYLLVAKPLQTWAAPDPSDGNTTVYVVSPAPLATPPVVRIDPPHGRSFTVPATALGPTTFQAPVSVSGDGVYRISVAGTVTTGQRLIGSDAFEVLPAEDRRKRWEPVGPNNSEGQLTLAPGAPQQAVVAQPYKAGPWLTTDGGVSWEQLNRLPVQYTVGQGTIVVDAAQPNRWWYSVNNTYTGRTEILRTTDRGRTWETLPFSGQYVSAFVSDRQTRVLVAVTTAGLEISTDRGTTWVAQPSGMDEETLYASIDNDTLYLGTARGIWARSGIASGNPGPATKIYTAEGSFPFIGGMVTTDKVIAAYVSQVGVVGSYDGGVTWKVLHGLEWGGYTLHGSGDDIYLSTFLESTLVGRHHGRDWSEIPTPVPASVMVDYDRWADGSLSVAASSAGVYRGAADGTAYRRIGVQGGTVHDLAVTGGALIAGTFSGVYRTPLPVASPEWGSSGEEGMIGVTISHLAVSPTDPNVVWRIRRNAFGAFDVDRSGDAGQTWQWRSTQTEVPTSLAIHPADANRIMVGWASLLGQGIHATTDGGATWKNLWHDQVIRSIAGDPGDPKKWWIGTDTGLYHSSDGGATLAKKADGEVRTILLQDSRIVIGGVGIRVSNDGGRTFHEGNTGPLWTQVNDLIKVGDQIFAATNRGVLRAGDGGQGWRNVSSGLQNREALCLAATPDGSAIYVGTRDGGVHRMSLNG